MTLPNIEHLSLEAKADQETAVATEGKMPTDNAVADNHKGSTNVERAIAAIEQYLETNSPIYRKLHQVRAEGWQNSAGDKFFARQRHEADENSAKTVHQLNKLMKNITNEMQRVTKAFTIKSETEAQGVLDLCMAPGTYLMKALECNPTAHVVAFTLPPKQGGLIPMVRESETVKIHMLDITMLAADMGMGPGDIPESHPDATNFLHSRHLEDGRGFDLVICDGAIRRTQERATYRMHRESRRLLLTQLALGLEHLRVGGTMIILLHKVERLNTIRLLRDFESFATVFLFKPKSGHAKRSSFYLIASNIKSTAKQAVEAVKEWKRDWKLSTLGTDEEWREDYDRVARFGELGIEGVLEEFGPTLVKRGENIWRIQADALKRAPFMKK